jgi:HD superfamily phosphodiesterase
MGELLEKELDRITAEISDDTRRKTLDGYLKSVPDKLMELSASSSGKFHPAHDNGPGGLLRHSRIVVRLASRLYSSLSETKGLQRDSLITAALIHDFGKYGKECELSHTVHDHPLIGAEMFRDYCKKLRLNDENKQWVSDVCRLVERHTGRWITNKYSDIILPKPEKMDEWMLHFADYISATLHEDTLFDREGHLSSEIHF